MQVLLIHQGFVSPNELGGTRRFELGRRAIEQGHQFTVVASDIRYLPGECVLAFAGGRIESRGWRAPYYNYREPALSLDLTARASVLQFWTLLVPNRLKQSRMMDRLNCKQISGERQSTCIARETNGFL